MSNPIQSKAVLADVTVKHWTGRKLDKRVSEEVNQQYGAQSDAGRYNKLLIPRDSFDGVYSATQAARRTHHVLTQPWFDDGPRVLPTMLYDMFASELREIRQKFDAAADEFSSEYPSWLKEAPKRLEKMFDRNDYPDPNHVRGMFSFHVRIFPFPDVQDFRVKLGKDQLDDIKSDMEDQLKEALDNAMKEPVRRIIQVVGKMAEKLKGYKPADPSKKKKTEGLFRDSMVSNIRELADLLPAFNLTGDKVLTELTKRIEKELCVNEAQDLREDAAVRKAVAKSAEDILKQAEMLMA